MGVGSAAADDAENDLKHRLQKRRKKRAAARRANSNNEESKSNSDEGNNNNPAASQKKANRFLQAMMQESPEDPSSSSEEEEDMSSSDPLTFRGKAKVTKEFSNNTFTRVAGGFLHPNQVTMTPNESCVKKSKVKKSRNDGIYRNDDALQSISAQNIYRVSQRLHREFPNKKDTFNCDNSTMKITHPVVATHSTRPVSSKNAPELVFSKPPSGQPSAVLVPAGVVKTNRVKNSTASSNSIARLVISIKQIALYDHPLFSPEDKCYLSLRQHYSQYCSRVTTSGDKIRFASSRYEEFHNIADLGTVMEELSAFVKCFEGTYGAWNDLKQIRKSQGFVSTPAVLTLRKTATTTLHSLKIQDDNNDNDADDLQSQYNDLSEKYKKMSSYVIKLDVETSVLSADTEAPAVEVSRRDSVRRMQLYASVLVNDKVLKSTKVVSLESYPVAFSTEFDNVIETISLTVVNRPTNNISVNVYQKLKNALFWKNKTLRLSSHNIPIVIPGRNNKFAYSTAPSDLWYQFASEKSFTKSRHVSGAIHAIVLWKTSSKAVLLPPNLDSHSLSSDNNRFIKPEASFSESVSGGADSKMDFANESDFISLVKREDDALLLDPNNPVNRNVLKLRSAKTDASSITTTVYQTPTVENRLKFTPNNATYALPKRLVLLQKRENEIQNPNIASPIPLSEESIKNDAAYMEIIRPEFEFLSDDSEDGDSDNEEKAALLQQKKKIYKFLKTVRSTQSYLHKISKKSIKLSSVVHEPVLPWNVPVPVDEKTFFQKLFTRRRRLRPSAKIVRPTGANVTSCRMIIQIESATNIPARAGEKRARRKRTSDDDSDDDSDSDNNYGGNNDSTSTFVSATFQENTNRTTLSSSSNPMWMETIVLPVMPLMNDFSPANVAKLSNENVVINVFDQVFIDERDLGGHFESENQNFVRTEDRFLGSVSIPFGTIFNAGAVQKVRGTFELSSPIYQLGYHKKEEKIFLNVMATLDPPLQTPPAAADENLAEQLANGICTESSTLVDYATKWSTLNNSVSLSSLFVTTLHGKKVFASRFIRPQKPPVEVQRSPHSLLRFTSLIPFVDDWITSSSGKSSERKIDLWCTSQEFLDIKAGDWEEHAVLLCNYFLWYDKNDSDSTSSYIVVASAVPEGDGVYVLRQTNDSGKKDTVQSTLYNASTGKSYDLTATNTTCPIKSISVLISSDNVYANVQQKTSSISLLNWKVKNNTSCWKPFFTKNFAKPSGFSSVQPSERLSYFPIPSRESIIQLETSVNETLRIHIRRWRAKRFTTSFHADASIKLRKLCMKLEEVEMKSAKMTQAEHDDAIYLNGYKAFGTPINMTYTTTDVLISAIENTNIHWNEHPNAQFALGVYIHAYPNDLMSVWVYFCSLTPI